MANIGAPEVVLILLGIIVFSGAKKIPDLARGLGKGVREFKRAAREIENETTAITKTE